MAKIQLLFVLVIFICVNSALSDKKHKNKYSKEANDNDIEGDLAYLKDLKNPLRIFKLNLVWEKAVKRLSLPKLKKLLKELRIQDKEELTLKKLKSEGGDKGGIKEAELRKKLLGILNNYGLSDHFQDKYVPPPKMSSHDVNKALFVDKKLNKLWDKATRAGFSEYELKALKEEFDHHQDKINQYNTLIDEHHQTRHENLNSLDSDDNELLGLDQLEASDKHSPHPTNTIREKHREIKVGYDRLHKITSTGPDNKEFIEPKVAGLWKLATKSDFTEDELQSLHTELKHYESRLLKVRHITAQIDLKEDYKKIDEKIEANTSTGQNYLQEKLEKQKRKVDKLHEDLELRILARHTEL